jgi:hypothetical protein
MTPTHLHYDTTIHYFLLQTKSNPSKEFSDTGIEGSDGQAEADSDTGIEGSDGQAEADNEVKTQ